MVVGHVICVWEDIVGLGMHKRRGSDNGLVWGVWLGSGFEGCKGTLSGMTKMRKGVLY